MLHSLSSWYNHYTYTRYHKTYDHYINERYHLRSKSLTHDKWVPVTSAWCILRVQMEVRPSIWRVVARCWQFLTIKTSFVTKHEHLNQTWIDTLIRTKQRKREVKFGMWNVRNLYRAGWLRGAARELARYKLHFVGVGGLVGTKRAR